MLDFEAMVGYNKTMMKLIFCRKKQRVKYIVYDRKAGFFA